MSDYSLNNWIILLVFVILISIISYINYRVLVGYKKKTKIISEHGKLRYLELANLLPQMVVEINSDGKFEFINKAGLEFIGYSKFELENMTIFSLIHSDDKDKFKEEFLYLIEGGENKGQEFRIITKNKDVFVMVFYLKRLSFEIDKREGLRGFIIDISDRVELERKVLSTIIDTEDKERRRFSEDLHDGLGPLLSTVKLYVNQMKSSKVSISEEKEMFNYANELLDEAIVTTRNIAINILPGSIVDNGLVAAVRTFVSHIKQVGGLKILFNENFEKRFDSKIEINVYRIIIELLNNSIKYANATTVDIDLILDDDKLILNYHDDGVGFDLEKVEKGLGHVNIVNRSQSLNGDYEYFSEINKGMTFKLTIKV